jgi:hypothetical protein
MKTKQVKVQMIESFNMKQLESKKIRKEREQEEPWSCGLSNRVYNILWNSGIRGRQETRSLVGKGDYMAYRNSRLSRLRNFGWKAYVELCRWVGLPEPSRETSGTIEQDLIEVKKRLMSARNKCHKEQSGVAFDIGTAYKLVEQICDAAKTK